MLKLNKNQQQAVNLTEGSVLVLAGAGSGKTRVLTERVAYLINELRVAPWSILAITFTNKAAAEMKERIAKVVDVDINSMWVCTFHAMCVRMLRRYADKIGYTSNFLIYDTEDSLRVIKRILEKFGLKENKNYGEKFIKNLISRYKNDDTTQDFGIYAGNINPFIAENALNIFEEYTMQLHMQNAMDFDDLLLNTYVLLTTCEEAREYYQNKFNYVMVDEYQDTNMVQYRLVKLLSKKHKNIFVVGDEDQSIYAFRGANIRNILEFEKDFPGACVIKLEQNYRSAKTILDVANCIIKNNEGRHGKKLFSDILDGDKPVLYTAKSEFDEAETIAREVQKMTQAGANFNEIAVLYRMHTLSRIIEEKLRMYAIPYRIYGGISFYSRKEIKDIVAYLNIIANKNADVCTLRIINTPKRAIGDAKVAALLSIATREGISLIDVMEQRKTLITDGSLYKKAEEFYNIYETISKDKDTLTVSEIINNVYVYSGYKAMLEEENTEEAKVRAENIAELLNSAYSYDNTEDSSLEGFLQNIALITDLDSMDETGGVTLMTIHSAKGLEFNTVFIAGMDENIFPSQRAIEEDNVEEERRLCYVATTRAKQNLFLTYASQRSLYGKPNPSMPSRFIEEVEKGLLNHINKNQKIVLDQKKKTKAGFFSGGMEVMQTKAQKVSSDFEVGSVVEHKSFGRGVIKSIAGEGDAKVALVNFDKAGQKKMFLAYAALKIV